MEELQQQAVQIYTRWQAVYEVLRKSPATAWQPHLPNANLEMVNEAVTTLRNFLVKADAPKGFRPTYELGKTVAASGMSLLMGALQQLEAGTYAQLPNFVSNIVAMLGAAHTMAIFSDRKISDKDTLGAALSARLSEGLGLLSTAQTELANKIALLEKATATAAAIETARQNVVSIEAVVVAAQKEVDKTRANAVEALALATTETQKEIEKAKGNAFVALESATAASNKIQLLEPSARELIRDTEGAQKRLLEMLNQTNSVYEKNAKQQALVDSLLPRAASAGLAAAFSVRGRSLETIKWVWMLAFLGAVGGLVYFAHGLLVADFTSPHFLNFLLMRIAVAAPLVWVGWFSAIQYGNNVRVQEDYAFKEATSKAFQGYRDHMQHLETVSSEDAGNAMNLLALETIKILAREPLRIYGATHDDAAPMQGAASKWLPWNFTKHSAAATSPAPAESPKPT